MFHAGARTNPPPPSPPGRKLLGSPLAALVESDLGVGACRIAAAHRRPVSRLCADVGVQRAFGDELETRSVSAAAGVVAVLDRTGGRSGAGRPHLTRGDQGPNQVVG